MLTPGGIPLRARSIPDELERRLWGLLIAIRESDPSSTSPCQEEYEVIDLVEEILRPRYPDKGELPADGQLVRWHIASPTTQHDGIETFNAAQEKRWYLSEVSCWWPIPEPPDRSPMSEEK